LGKLDGKVALVTGSSSGIGRAIAEGLAAEGASLVLAARRLDRLRELEKDLAERGTSSLAIQTDVTSEEDVAALFAATRERFGRLDILVNNAGTAARAMLNDTAGSGHPTSIEALPIAEWDRVIAVNLRGPFLCSQQAMRIMRPQQSGRIINIGSISAQRVRPNSGPYSASKFGIDGLTHVIALEGRPFGISCGVLHPGNTKSELGLVSTEPQMETEDLARAAVFMATAPAEMNVFQMVVIPVEQPYIGRG
jgi:NAD(P)-dependent dehydrogenase (short-subunit alcohol dehydrogenase family)